MSQTFEMIIRLEGATALREYLLSSPKSISHATLLLFTSHQPQISSTFVRAEKEGAGGRDGQAALSQKGVSLVYVLQKRNSLWLSRDDVYLYLLSPMIQIWRNSIPFWDMDENRNREWMCVSQIQMMKKLLRCFVQYLSHAPVLSREKEDVSLMFDLVCVLTYRPPFDTTPLSDFYLRFVPALPALQKRLVLSHFLNTLPTDSPSPPLKRTALRCLVLPMLERSAPSSRDGHLLLESDAVESLLRCLGHPSRCAPAPLLSEEWTDVKSDEEDEDVFDVSWNGGLDGRSSGAWRSNKGKKRKNPSDGAGASETGEMAGAGEAESAKSAGEIGGYGPMGEGSWRRVAKGKASGEGERTGAKEAPQFVSHYSQGNLSKKSGKYDITPESIQLFILLLQTIPTAPALRDLRMLLFRFASTHLKSNDVTVQMRSYALLCHLIVVYQDSSQRFVLRVFLALVRHHQPEYRALVYRALDILVPYLPKVFALPYPFSLLWSNKLVLEDGGVHAPPLFLLYILSRHPDLFYPFRSQCLPHVIPFLLKIVTMSSGMAESCAIGLDVVEVLLSWQDVRKESPESLAPSDSLSVRADAAHRTEDVAGPPSSSAELASSFPTSSAATSSSPYPSNTSWSLSPMPGSSLAPPSPNSHLTSSYRSKRRKMNSPDGTQSGFSPVKPPPNHPEQAEERLAVHEPPHSPFISPFSLSTSTGVRSGALGPEAGVKSMCTSPKSEQSSQNDFLSNVLAEIVFIFLIRVGILLDPRSDPRSDRSSRIDPFDRADKKGSHLSRRALSLIQRFLQALPHFRMSSFHFDSLTDSQMVAPTLRVIEVVLAARRREFVHRFCGVRTGTWNRTLQCGLLAAFESQCGGAMESFCSVVKQIAVEFGAVDPGSVRRDPWPFLQGVLASVERQLAQHQSWHARQTGSPALESVRLGGLEGAGVAGESCSVPSSFALSAAPNQGPFQLVSGMELQLHFALRVLLALCQERNVLIDPFYTSVLEILQTKCYHFPNDDRSRGKESVKNGVEGCALRSILMCLELLALRPKINEYAYPIYCCLNELIDRTNHPALILALLNFLRRSHCDEFLLPPTSFSCPNLDPSSHSSSPISFFDRFPFLEEVDTAPERAVGEEGTRGERGHRHQYPLSLTDKQILTLLTKINRFGSCCHNAVNKHYLHTLHETVCTPSPSGPPAPPRLELELQGMCSHDLAYRRLFLDSFCQRAHTPTVQRCIEYIVTAETWEPIGRYYWIRLAVAKLLTVVMDEPIALKTASLCCREQRVGGGGRGGSPTAHRLPRHSALFLPSAGVPAEFL